MIGQAAHSDTRARVLAHLESSRDEILNLARRIYAEPELSGEERLASAACAELLGRHGFEVESVPGVPTGFVATLDGHGDGPTIGLLAEYDALPGLGHACGHHLIAGAAVGAGLALAAPSLGLPGTVKVFGCPAEETLEGKVAMLAAGAFDGTDRALTFHGHETTSVMVSSTGFRGFRFSFRGRTAHGAEPTEGASALDGVLLTMNNVNALRQFVPDGARIHGFVPAGGEAVNVIPAEAACELAVRATDPMVIDRVAGRVLQCAQAGALASGTELTVEPLGEVQPTRSDPRIADLVRKNLLDRGELEIGEWAAQPSTDFGDVSQAIPSVLFSVATWPKGTGFHNPQTTEAAGLEQAWEAMLTGAAVMALTAVDLINGVDTEGNPQERQ